jgi:hypothetical protein
MILEGIVTTIAPTGEIHIAPMGPRVDGAMQRLVLRPFRTAQTYWNLCKHGEGVFHVTDDVLMLAQAAVGRLTTVPALLPARKIRGHILADACRAYEFRVSAIDDREERVNIELDVLTMVRQRDFFGFNRAKHAVVEAAILATRINLLAREQIEEEYRKLSVLVQKTGGEQEHEAFRFLEAYVRESQAVPGEESP